MVSRCAWQLFVQTSIQLHRQKRAEINMTAVSRGYWAVVLSSTFDDRLKEWSGSITQNILLCSHFGASHWSYGSPQRRGSRWTCNGIVSSSRPARHTSVWQPLSDNSRAIPITKGCVRNDWYFCLPLVQCQHTRIRFFFLHWLVGG